MQTFGVVEQDSCVIAGMQRCRASLCTPGQRKAGLRCPKFRDTVRPSGKRLLLGEATSGSRGPTQPPADRVQGQKWSCVPAGSAWAFTYLMGLAMPFPLLLAAPCLCSKLGFLGGEMEEHGNAGWMERSPLPLPPQWRCPWDQRGALS